MLWSYPCNTQATTIEQYHSVRWISTCMQQSTIVPTQSSHTRACYLVSAEQSHATINLPYHSVLYQKLHVAFDYLSRFHLHNARVQIVIVEIPRPVLRFIQNVHPKCPESRVYLLASPGVSSPSMLLPPWILPSCTAYWPPVVRALLPLDVCLIFVWFFGGWLPAGKIVYISTVFRHLCLQNFMFSSSYWFWLLPKN